MFSAPSILGAEEVIQFDEVHSRVGPGLNAYLWRLVHVSDFLWYLAPILARLVHFADNRQFAQPDSLATRVATNLDGRET